MSLTTSPFSILNKKRREMDYINVVYKRIAQSQIESNKGTKDEDKRDIIQYQDILMLDMISI